MSRLRIAWVQMRSQLGQLAIAVIVIALGVALAAGMLLANAALREGFEESVAALAGRADLEVSALSGGTIDEAVLETVRGVKGVEAAAPLLLGMGFIETGGRVRSGAEQPPAEGSGAPDVEAKKRVRLRVVGVDMLDDASVRVYRSSTSEEAGIEDPLIFMNQPDSALAPQQFLDRHGYKRDDAIELETPGGHRRLVVRGVLAGQGVGQAFGGEFVVMDLYSAQDVLAANGRLSQVDVVVGEGESAVEVAERLRKELPGFLGVKVVAERRAELSRTAAGFQLMLSVIGALGLVLAAVITANRLATVHQERLWEMGVLRGMGWTPAGLLRDLLLEALLLSTLASVLGLPVGYALSRIIVQPVANSMELNLKQAITVSSVHARPGPLVLACAAGILAGTLAAFIPASKAARTPIATLKARRRRRDPWPETQWKRCARFGFPLLAAVLLGAQAFLGIVAVGGLTMLALVAAGGFLIVPALQLLSRYVGTVLGPAAWVGVRDQSRAPSRAIGATAVLMAGIGLVVWIGSTGRSFERYVVDILTGPRQGDLIVDSALLEDLGAAGDSDVKLSEDIVASMAEIPGVKLVGAEVFSESREPVVGIVAADPIRLTQNEFGLWRLATGADTNALERVAQGAAVLANRQFVTAREVKVGDSIRVMTPSGPLDRPIAGIVEASFLSPQGDLILSRPLFKEYWRDSTITRAFVVLTEGASEGEVEAEIERRVSPTHKVRVRSAKELGDWFGESVRRGFAFMGVMIAATLLVVLIGTGDALAASIIERTREIGTLRSLGYRPANIAMMVIGQALVIGLAGVALAVPLGMGMAYAFVEGLLPTTLGWQLKLYPTYGVVVLAAAAGIAACVVGALLPAYRAARLPIVSALRHE